MRLSTLFRRSQVEERDGIMYVGGNLRIFTKDVKIMTMGRRKEDLATPVSAAPTGPEDSNPAGAAPTGVNSGASTAEDVKTPPSQEIPTPSSAQPSAVTEVSLRYII